MRTEDIQIGDHIRFLDSTGGGIVTKIDEKKKVVFVEDEDGFNIPTPLSQIVLSAKQEGTTSAKTIKATTTDQPTMRDIQTKAIGEAQIISKEEKKAKGKREPKKEDILEVDLHINALCENPALMERNEMLQYQLRVFEHTMQENLGNRGKKIVFIHGRGEGILKAAISSRLSKQYHTCEYYDASFAQYGFGATMVVIR